MRCYLEDENSKKAGGLCFLHILNLWEGITTTTCIEYIVPKTLSLNEVLILFLNSH